MPPSTQRITPGHLKEPYEQAVAAMSAAGALSKIWSKDATLWKADAAHHKGGPPAGMFVVITAQHAEDLAIPGAKYTFGQTEMAQALGEVQSLGQREKPALHLHLTQGAAGGLAALRKLVEGELAARADRA